MTVVGGAGLHLEDKDQDGKANTRDDAKGDSAPPRAKVKTSQNNQQL
jgi:hypothetical protein